MHSNIGPADFREMLAKTDLTEMLTRGCSFTWSNGAAGDARRESKIDWVFMNKNWIAIWPANDL